ncbi:hypothetical protein SAMN02745784_00402 [Tissierella praeacuta DSM 18095]|uniref:Hook-length control protein FliK n=1 Tax=Tissierella praeacuta DSM 18095 TaxID=1123404 RepID=A0A1M4SNN0_9FIRM|nr:hypothetical protein [Tissierella praeacuta]SHE33537.1 hypothetical protein SAMN02745784_00402 [Tissierella praeacuta DSM 18095]SUP01583.1 Uncharacterised protein [Tissierella praeacuta]
MRIENLLLNNFILNNKEDILSEGYTFKGKVLELIDDLIFIEIDGKRTIQAKLETDMKMNIDDEISFLVKSVDDNEIVLKPIIKEKLQLSIPKENNPISNLLKNMNIKENKISMKLVENLMRYNAPITEENITDGIKTLEKLFQLSNLTNEDKVVLINNSSPMKKDLILEKIENIQEKTPIKIDSNPNRELITEENIVEDNTSPDKVDIKSLLVISKADDKEHENIASLIEEFVVNGDNVDFEEDIKIISFFLKHNIKPSLNNIKNLRELNENPIEFVKDLKLIDKRINKDSPKSINGIQLENNETKYIISDKDTKILELQKNISNFENTKDLKLAEDVKNFTNKIDFLKDMNKNLSFVFFPIKHMEKELDGVLTLIKEDRKKKNYNGKTNIYINVETYNLGNIKVSCQLSSNVLQIKMNIRNEDLELFKSTEKQLIEKISLIGYSLDRIDFILDNSIRIIDTIVSNPNPIYILDLKV